MSLLSDQEGPKAALDKQTDNLDENDEECLLPKTSKKSNVKDWL